MIRIFLLLLLTSCSSIGSIESLDSQYEVITGPLIKTPVRDSRDRLFLFVSKGEENIVALLRNKKEPYVIQEIEKSLILDGKPVLLYGERIEGQVEEILAGIDFEVYVIAFYSNNSERYMYIQVNYSRRAMESIKEFDVKSIIPLLLEQTKKLL